MYWALTGREPFPETGHVFQDLRHRMLAPAADVRKVRPEVPEELADLILKLTAPDPDDRYQSARAVAATLAGLAKWVAKRQATAGTAEAPSRRPRVLVVDDDGGMRALVRSLLTECDCSEAADGRSAWAELQQQPFDLVVLDVNLPGMSGPELMSKLRERGRPDGLPKVLVVSGDVPPEALGGLVLDGADDFVEKPFAAAVFRSRTRSLLGTKEAAATPNTTAPPLGGTDRTEARGRDTVRFALADLTRKPAAPPPATSTPVTPPPAPRTALVRSSPVEPLAYTTCRLLEEIGLVTAGYHERMPRYLRALAAAVRDQGEYTRLKDQTYMNLLAAVAPMHDAGQLVVPTEILLKPSKLDAEELSVLQNHTVFGSEVLVDLSARLPASVSDLTLAAEVVRHHHEKWDGTGYPDRLAGADIPLSARLVAVVSVYEALRTRRPQRPPLTHPLAVRLMQHDSPGQFDPTLMTAFAAAAPRFDEICQSGGR
jgi:response regulator RpfG family c-di-GMP phosphodiesterase